MKNKHSIIPILTWVSTILMTIYQKHGIGSSEMVNYQRGGELRWKYHLLVGVEAGGGGEVTEKGQTWEIFSYQAEGSRTGRWSL